MPLRLGRHALDGDEPLIMAIVNRTPDSFFDRGATFSDEAALTRVAESIAQGAHIIDVGGVKAGPGEPVDSGEEIRRTAEFIGEIRGRHPDAVISIDTWRAEVGAAACQAGADLINDAWGGWDPELAQVAAAHGAGLVCTHTGGAKPRTRPHRAEYADVMADVVNSLREQVSRAVAAGVDAESILVDPGHDFGKNTWHSLEVTRRLPELTATGLPVLVSLSNKDFVGETLDVPVTARLTGTLAATAICAWLGARVFRVHNVAETAQTLDMVSSIQGRRPPAVTRRGLA